MKSIIILFLTVAILFTAWRLNKWVQKIIKPRTSFGRLFFYFLIVLFLVFILSFLLVLIITKLYPGELIK